MRNFIFLFLLLSCGKSNDSFLYSFVPGMNIKASSTVYYLPVTCDHDTIQMQGSGLCNGKILNYRGEELPAFVPPPPERHHEGISGILNVLGYKNEIIEPFRCFASALDYNLVLYLPELDGKVITYTDMYQNMEGKIIKFKKTVKHDGCLINLDTGSAFNDPNSHYYRGAPTPEKIPIDFYVGLSENLKILPQFTDKRILHEGTYMDARCENFNWNLPIILIEILENDVNLEDLVEDPIDNNLHKPITIRYH